ncbi:DUF262 domain-containing protein [Burkholderia ubonensis]|uniref:DUF262 domain-containing protein n=1 Tax=Burkholderia ubonensis TaxID=101571 RepID=UPI00075AEDE5|nr:DUF262 domain-containing protein [Burkholderia ubonensis]
MSTNSKKIVRLQDQLQKERRLVSFDSYDVTIKQLLDMYEDGHIFVPPEYQRQFVWGVDRQSQLIESVFLGIPIPSLFMATNPDSTWEVVDGVQRIGTLAHFVGTSELLRSIGRDVALQISGLEKLPDMIDLKFTDLPGPMQLMFTTRPIRVTVLNDKSDMSVRFDLFERLNTGGISLTDQEIRNCVYRGPFNDDLKGCAVDPNFESAIKLKSTDENNGSKEEFVLRFFAFLDNYQQFDHSVKGFLNDYMKARLRNRLTPEEKGVFKKTFEFLASELPRGIIRGNRSITPINLFEAAAVGVALCIRGRRNPKKGRVEEALNSAELREFTTGATNSRRRVAERIEFVLNAVK